MANPIANPRDRYRKYRSQNYEVKTVRLVSPMLPIGSEVQQLSKFEYVRSGDWVYFPRQDALARRLYDRGGRFLNDYIDCIERDRSIGNLLVEAFGDDWREEKTEDGRLIFPRKLPIWSLQDPDKLQDVRPMIRNGMGELYVPGSSIKGAIRTAIAYRLLQEREGTPVGRSALEERIRASLDAGELQGKRQQKFYDDRAFMNDMFEDFNLHYQEKDIDSKTGPNTDFMRAIKVWDSEPLVTRRIPSQKQPGKFTRENIPVISEVIVSSYFAGQNRRAKYRASIFTECVRTVKTQFQIAIDFAMLESWFCHRNGMKIPFDSVESLLELCKDFARQQWQQEATYWARIRNNTPTDLGPALNFYTLRETFYPKKCPCTLRLGWGSGMFGTTIATAIAPELRQEIRDACGIAAPGFEAPKSRRTAVNQHGELAFPLGWSQLKIVDG